MYTLFKLVGFFIMRQGKVAIPGVFIVCAFTVGMASQSYICDPCLLGQVLLQFTKHVFISQAEETSTIL